MNTPVTYGADSLRLRQEEEMKEYLRQEKKMDEVNAAIRDLNQQTYKAVDFNEGQVVLNIVYGVVLLIIVVLEFTRG
jgi:hypothetical protein